MKIDYELMEKYFNHLLNEEERTAFDLRLKEDPEFKKEVQFYKNTILQLENSYSNKERVIELENTIIDIKKDYFKKEAKVISFREYLIPLLAAAAILLVAILVWYPNETLYEQYAEHKPLEVMVKGDDSELLREVANQFNAANYEPAKKSLQSYLAKSPNDLELKMALGICYMELNQSDSAKVIFLSEEIQKSVFKNKGEWYYALSLVKNKEFNIAKVVLHELDENSEYYELAQELLAKLK